MSRSGFYSSDPMDYIRVALAIETLAYHDKRYLNSAIRDNATISDEVTTLLKEALKAKEGSNERKTDC